MCSFPSVSVHTGTKGPCREFALFGRQIGEAHLGNLVNLLFVNATSKTTRQKARTGRNHFREFCRSTFGFNFVPPTHSKVSLNAMLLCFFAASLFNNPKNFAYSTIRNYVGHVRSGWANQGTELSPFDRAILTRVFRGVRALRPAAVDSRLAFLLPHYNFPRIFTSPISIDHLIFKAAVVLGFLGMFRFSTFHKLNVNNTFLIDRSGREFTLTPTRSALVHSPNIVGFYFSFSSKYHPNAQAYYCSLRHLPQPWSTLCPVTILRLMEQNGLLSSGHLFPREKLTSAALGTYMEFVARSRHSFTPHSLRIGGHTFFSAHNMDEDLVQFLGRRTITKASQLYYRARAADNVSRLNMFFTRLSQFPVINEGGVFKNLKQLASSGF